MERHKNILLPLIIAAGMILIIKMTMPAYAAETPAESAAAEDAAGNTAGENAAGLDITLPVYWVKECRNADEATKERQLGGIGSDLYELTDEEAMYWDANEKEKNSLTIPSDHAIAISTKDGAFLWTPNALPKKADGVDGMPLMRYEIRSEDKEGRMAVRLLTSMDLSKENDTFFLQSGPQGITVTCEGKESGEIVSGKEMALYIVYKDAAVNKAVHTVINGIGQSVSANPLPFVLVLIGGVAMLLLPIGKRHDEH